MSTTPLWVQRALTPGHGDSADLRWAIETAAAMWSRGDRPQALRWLQHAVQTAHVDGRGERAAELGRAVTELERLGSGSQAPAAFPPVSMPEQPAKSEDTVQSMSMKKTTPFYRVTPDDITKLEAPTPQLLQESAARDPIDTDPDLEGVSSGAGVLSADATLQGRPRPPPSSDAESTMTSVRLARSRDKVERTMVMEIEPPESTPVSAGMAASSPPSGVSWRMGAVQSESTLDIESTRSPPSSPERSSAVPTTLESPQGHLEALRAVRVAIESGSGNRLTLMLLADDQQAPPGMQEALLVPLTSKPDAG